MHLSENAKHIFFKEPKYCLQSETIEDCFKRVAKEFASNEEEEKLTFDLLDKNIWRPNTPVFLNSGTNHRIFSACYVAGLEDSMDSIYNIADTARKIFQYGAGIGIPIGNLRESEAYIYEGDESKPPEGRSSGPLTFMKLYDAVGHTTKSGGRVRRAAILCAMPVWHPDIIHFISCKEKEDWLTNMNISVLITDKFMQSLADGTPFDLITPYDGSKVGTVDPQEVWNRLAHMSHKSAEPGVIFIDQVNRFNPLIKDFMINCTNPCGEQPLMPFGCCNLSAINLSKFIDGDGYNFGELYNIAKKVMKLMDNVIDTMDYPDSRFKDTALKYRPVGVGMMGLADTLFALNYRYDGPDGRKFAAECMKTITTACVEMSTELAEEKGPFYNYERYKADIERLIEQHTGGSEEIMEKVSSHGVRNMQFTTCQPTGTVALSCDASYGIEPSMGLVFQKNLISGDKMIVANSTFTDKYEQESWYSQQLVDKIFNNGGSLKGIHGIPKEVRETFVVAHDINYRSRLDMQAAIQEYCSTAISSTVNLPQETTKDDIADLFLYAHQKGLKGVTIYRDGSKKSQPVTFNKKEVDEFKRPNRLNSETFTVETGNGKVYVTVSDENGKPVEVFLFIGKSGQILNSFSEALGRVLSLALQNEVPIGKLIKTLDGISSDSIAWHRFEDTDQKPTQILSIPDGISKLLNRYYLDNKPHTNGGTSGEICPKCGLNMSATEGCFACTCGYSKCT